MRLSLPLRAICSFLLGFLIAISFGQQSSAGRSSSYQPIHLKSGYDHAKYAPLPDEHEANPDFVKTFRAYVTVFDGPDDDDGDGVADLLGVPHYVAYEMHALSGTQKKGGKRPSPWITEKDLAREKTAPFDDTYAYSRAFRDGHDNWYVRGHLCMKQHAGRLGKRAEWNTHTVLNAVPQRAVFNGGIWLDLEKKTGKWADKFGAVWVIAGPVFYDVVFDDVDRIGESFKNEMEVAIPDALFKIVIRETQTGLETLAFIYAQDVTKRIKGQPYDHTAHAVSIDEIESLTGFDFVLPDAANPLIEAQINQNLWD